MILSGNVKLPERELKLNLHSDIASFKAGFPPEQILNSDRAPLGKNQRFSNSYADFPVAKHLTGSSGNLLANTIQLQNQASPMAAQKTGGVQNQ